MGEAYQYSKRVTEIKPHLGTGWLNHGRIAGEMFYFTESEFCYQRAMSAAGRDDRAKSLVYVNWSCMLADRGDYVQCENMARKAIALNADSRKARANLGIALLAQGQWKEGWPLYDEMIGFDESRKRIQYGDEDAWNGSETSSVVIYGEQGLGDEIMFASMLPSVKCRKLILDVDHRLAGLFRRSFPQATVYGTRWKDGVWKPEDQTPDASLSIAGLGKMLRNSGDSFPRQAYLLPDPDRTLACKSVLWAKHKPIIGLAWTGGMPWTGAKFRKMRLLDMLPILRSVDAHFVVLQYKNASTEVEELQQLHPDIDIKQYPYWTLTDDYDDTAALVAACDLVIGPPTSVIHLAGAIGTEAWMMKSPYSCWKVSAGLPFHAPVRMFPHLNDWPSTVATVAAALKEKQDWTRSASLLAMTLGNPSPTTSVPIV